MGLSQYDENVPVIGQAQVVPADLSNAVTIIATPTQALRIDSLLCASTATADHEVVLALKNGSLYAPLGTFSVPLGSGHTTIPIVDVAALLAPTQIGGWLLYSPWSLVVLSVTTMEAGTKLELTAQGGIF